jgi:prolyl-tRNA editing enzyme YbaK/EbsC (Cys-tRNA(Pro) deacylase)
VWRIAKTLIWVDSSRLQHLLYALVCGSSRVDGDRLNEFVTSRWSLPTLTLAASDEVRALTRNDVGSVEPLPRIGFGSPLTQHCIFDRAFLSDTTASPEIFVSGPDTGVLYLVSAGELLRAWQDLIGVDNVAWW